MGRPHGPHYFFPSRRLIRPTIQALGLLKLVQGRIIIFAFPRIQNAHAQGPIQLGRRHVRSLGQSLGGGLSAIMAQAFQFTWGRRTDPADKSFPFPGLHAQGDERPQVRLAGRRQCPLVPGRSLALGHVAHQFLVAQIVRVFLEISPRCRQRLFLPPQLAEQLRFETLQRIGTLIVPISGAVPPIGTGCQ